MNMKLHLLAILLILGIKTFAQSHYEEVIRFNNGKIKSIITYNSNNIKDGNTVNYHPNTTIQSVIPFVNGKIQGIVFNYYENGNVESMGNVVNDQPQGTFIYYHRNATQKAIFEFLNGKIIQVNGCFDRKKNPLYCGPFNNGNGEIYIYNEDGKLIAKDYFKNGDFIKSEKVY